jgi:hypothetical protein
VVVVVEPVIVVLLQTMEVLEVLEAVVEQRADL